MSYKLARITTNDTNELEKIALVTKVKLYLCSRLLQKLIILFKKYELRNLFDLINHWQ